jgi:hypothetical protein
MIGNKIRKGKIWCKTNVKNKFGSNYKHKPLRSNWIQMVRDHDEPLEVYVSRKNEIEAKMFKEHLRNGRLQESNVGQSDIEDIWNEIEQL